MERFDVEVRTDQLDEVRRVPAQARAIGAGEIEVAIDRAALTANNVTYGAVGNEVGYWRFFPASEPGWGRIPVWGFANVTASEHEDIAVGERLYGFWPMSSHLILRPDRVGSGGFMDGAEHRRPLPAVYNSYVRCQADPLHVVDAEPWQSLFRPLFMTALMLEDFFEDNDAFGAKRIILSSASSKTALGTGFLFRRRGAREVVGLTSASNEAFVSGAATCDRVLTYDRIGELDGSNAVYIDFAGNSALRREIHEHLGPALRFSSAVGYSHLGTLEHGQKLPGPTPEFFFAPTQIAKREQDWRDSGGVGARFAEAWQAFLPRVSGSLRLENHVGAAAGMAAFQALVRGSVDPQLGEIVDWSA
ncbi:MAG: DUF2855 family protein [Pseudomonadota bacterium]